MCFQVLEYMLYYINQTKLAYFFLLWEENLEATNLRELDKAVMVKEVT